MAASAGQVVDALRAVSLSARASSLLLPPSYGCGRGWLVPSLAMGLREGLWKLLARGDAGEPDPDEMVELVTVPEHEGPLMQANLAAHGIDATLQVEYNVAIRKASLLLVRVRRADFDEAQEIITS